MIAPTLLLAVTPQEEEEEVTAVVVVAAAAAAAKSATSVARLDTSRVRVPRPPLQVEEEVEGAVETGVGAVVAAPAEVMVPRLGAC